MVNFAIVENGVVTNIAVADPEFAKEQGWIPARSAAIGDIYDGTAFHRPDPPVKEEKPVTASEILSQLTSKEAEKLVDVLVLREVLTPERAEKLKQGK